MLLSYCKTLTVQLQTTLTFICTLSALVINLFIYTLYYTTSTIAHLKTTFNTALYLWLLLLYYYIAYPLLFPLSCIATENSIIKVLYT